LDALRVPIDSVATYSRNPRVGDVKAIGESLRTTGQYRPIVVRRPQMEVLAGNHTLLAARSLGWREIAATFVECTDEEAARIVAADNRTADLGGYDDELLADLLAELAETDLGLAGTGYDDKFLASLLADDLPEPGPDDDVLPDSVPEITRLGDLWELGPHRVVCGDSTNVDVLRYALGGEAADCVWTDPPYGVSYVGGTKDALEIKNDNSAGLEALLRDAFAAMSEVVAPGAPVYVAHADTARITFETQLAAAGFRVRQNLVWVKSSIALGHSDYHYRHEPILYAEGAPEVFVDPDDAAHAAGVVDYHNDHEPVLYGFGPGGSGRLGRGGPAWQGDNAQSSVFEVAKPKANRQHPTMKPVRLVWAMLKNSLARGGLVLDLFGGSGSTLLAAHYHGSRAALVELDPRFVDVICARFQAATGVLPVRDGEPVDFSELIEDEG